MRSMRGRSKFISFNSIVVRLRQDNQYAADYLHSGFNSIVVRLRPGYISRDSLQVLSFNSIVVRLRLIISVKILIR